MACAPEPVPWSRRWRVPEVPVTVRTRRPNSRRSRSRRCRSSGASPGDSAPHGVHRTTTPVANTQVASLHSALVARCWIPETSCPRIDVRAFVVRSRRDDVVLDQLCDFGGGVSHRSYPFLGSWARDRQGEGSAGRASRSARECEVRENRNASGGSDPWRVGDPLPNSTSGPRRVAMLWSIRHRDRRRVP